MYLFEVWNSMSFDKGRHLFNYWHAQNIEYYPSPQKVSCCEPPSPPLALGKDWPALCLCSLVLKGFDFNENVLYSVEFCVFLLETLQKAHMRQFQQKCNLCVIWATRILSLCWLHFLRKCGKLLSNSEPIIPPLPMTTCYSSQQEAGVSLPSPWNETVFVTWFNQKNVEERMLWQSQGQNCPVEPKQPTEPWKIMGLYCLS